MSDSTLSTSTTGQPSMKTCTQCGTQKLPGEFRPYSGSSPDGLRPLCKLCQRDYEKGWRSQRKEYLRKARQARRSTDAAHRWIYNDTDIANYLVSRLKNRATKKGLPFDLDQHLPELKERMSGRVCEMTGTPLVLSRGKPGHNSPSLDRIIPEKGYTYDNIRIVCFAMNAALGSWGEVALRQVMDAWATKRGL